MGDGCNSVQYSYAEWKSNRMNVLVSAELDRASAERLSSETKRYLDEVKESSKEIDKTSKWNMQRIREEFRYWQTELSSKLEQIKMCIADITSIDRRLDKGLDVIKENSHIVAKCIEARCKRRMIYLVYDPPAKSLCKERETIESVMAQFCRIKAEVNDQLRVLRKVRYEIEKDLLEKLSSWDLEMESEEIKQRKREIENKTYDSKCEGQSCCPNCNTGGRSQLNTDQWLNQAKRVFGEAEKHRQSAKNLASVASSSMQQGKEELINIKIATDDAFKERISELRDHKYKMEDHLNKLVRQIQDSETLSQQLTEQVGKLSKRLSQDSNPGGCCQSHGNPEGIHVSSRSAALEQEKITDGIEKLKDNLACLQCSLQSLQRRKVEVEGDLALCNENLLIDDYQCLPLRQTIKYFLY